MKNALHNGTYMLETRQSDVSGHVMTWTKLPETILLQTKDSRIQQKILSVDLNYANTIKYGLSLEQGKKIDEIISSQSRPEDTRVA